MDKSSSCARTRSVACGSRRRFSKHTKRIVRSFTLSRNFFRTRAIAKFLQCFALRGHASLGLRLAHARCCNGSFEILRTDRATFRFLADAFQALQLAGGVAGFRLSSGVPALDLVSRTSVRNALWPATANGDKLVRTFVMIWGQ